MTKWIVFFALCFSSVAFALPIIERSIEPADLSELALALGIPREADVIAETQKRWLRKAGQERWEMAEISPEQRKFVLDWAAKQGLFSAWTPSQKAYGKALILGATTSRMQLRLDYLKQLWNEGVRFEQVVWLTGERPLDVQADEHMDRCRTETEAALLLWEKADLPDGMKTLPVLFVAVPMKKEGPLLKRPNTQDTIEAWIEIEPKPCVALFISDQPFCGYQFGVIKAVLPDSFDFEIVGPGANPRGHPAAAAITLDAIARWIYISKMQG